MQLSSWFCVLALCANCYRTECYANHKYRSVLIEKILQIVVIVIYSSISINIIISSSIIVEQQQFFWVRTDYINVLHSVNIQA
jgi:hypothetical protein